MQRDVEVNQFLSELQIPVCPLILLLNIFYFLQIEVETVDRTGTFLGSLWESRTNVAITLLEAGLAKLQTSFGSDRIPDFHLLDQAEQSAKRQKLKVRMGLDHVYITTLCSLLTILKRIVLQIWENFVEGEEVSNGAAVENKQQEVLKVLKNQDTFH